MKTITMNPLIVEVLEKLNQKYEAYLVGGSVRDALLNKETHDYDITTSATVIEMMEVFHDQKIIPTGIKHGTITLIYHDLPIEITTYRIEKNYLDHRTPEKCEFTRNLYEDLKRRDFTINALCANQKGEILDYFDGIHDLSHQIIRCIGDPCLRFNEDALRILRALRFSATLDFQIEENTKKALFQCAPFLKSISVERIVQEIKPILMSSSIESLLLEYHEIFIEIFKELDDLKRFYPKGYTCTLSRLKHAPKLETFRAIILFYEFAAHPDLLGVSVSTLLERYKFPNHLKKSFLACFKALFTPFAKNKAELKKQLYYNDEGTRLMLCILPYLKIDAPYPLLKEWLDEIDLNQECYTLSNLAINGNDCLDLPISKNEIKSTLEQVLFYVIENPEQNQRSTLLQYLLAISK